MNASDDIVYPVKMARPLDRDASPSELGGSPQLASARAHAPAMANDRNETRADVVIMVILLGSRTEQRTCQALAPRQMRASEHLVQLTLSKPCSKCALAD
jgi:hypothetical protein